MLSRALRGIDHKWLSKILLVGVMFFAVALPVFVPTEAYADTGTEIDCGIGSGQAVLGCFKIAAGWFIGLLVAIIGMVLYLAAMIFEATLEFSIGTNYNELTAIQSGWVLFRDLINMLFIFILLYIAFGTVLKIERVDWKKQLAAIIIAAILVNFSLFITRVVIDASNIVALGIHSQLTRCEGIHCTGTRTLSEGKTEQTITITEAITQSLGLPETFSMGAFIGDPTQENAIRNNAIRLGVISLITWAFISVALLFVVRTVVFVLLLVTSPVGVAGASLPMLQGPASEWRKNLFNQALVAPVFLLMLYIILRMSSDVIGLGNSNQLFTGNETSFPDVTGDTTSLGSKFWLNFVLLLAFIIAAVRITKDFSGKAGQMINDLGVKAVGIGVGAVGLAAGGAALAARQTIGRGAAAQLSGNRGERLLERANAGDVGALRQYNLLKGVAGSSLDVRQTALGKFGTRLLPKNISHNLSVGANIGTGGRLARIEKASDAYAKNREDLSADGKREAAEELARRGDSRNILPWSVLAKGANKRAADKLRRQANIQQTSKEERDKKILKAADELRANRGNKDEVKRIIGGLKSNELGQLPADVFSDPEVIKQLQIGDMRALQGNVDRETMEEIVKSDELDSKVKSWVDDPNNGFPPSGRPETSSKGNSVMDMSEEDFKNVQKEAAVEMGAVIGRVIKEQMGSQTSNTDSRRDSDRTSLVDQFGRPIERPSPSEANSTDSFGGRGSVNQDPKTSGPGRVFVASPTGETTVTYPNETTAQRHRRAREEEGRFNVPDNHPDWNKTESQLRDDIRRAEESNNEADVLRAEYILQEKQRRKS